MNLTHARSSCLLSIGMTITGCIAAAGNEQESEQGALGRDTQAIIHGVLDEGDAAVVMMRTESGLTCSGTLVAKNLVITAAHCLDAAAQAGVGFGIDGWSTPVGVHQQIAHPLWDGAYYSGHDVGLLVLATDVVGVAPVPVSGDPRAAHAGAALRIVGYGYDTAAPTKSGFGVKRQAAVHAGSQSDELFIQVGEPDGTQTCHGDSGGPAFYTDADGVEHLVGVASFGAESCQGGAFFTRLSAYVDFLDDYLSIVVPPLPPPPPPPPPPVDVLPPAVSLTSPVDGRTLLAGRRSIVFAAQDDVGVSDVVLHWSHNGKVIPCSAPPAGWSCRVSGDSYIFTADIGSGTRAFTAEAFDEAGNVTESPRYSLRFL